MTDEKWKAHGCRGIIDSLTTFLGHKEEVENTETGESREVFVKPGQEIGEAIAEGQFIDEEDDENEEDDDEENTNEDTDNNDDDE